MRVLGLAIALAACDGASSSPGLDALLQIPGAQFRPGPFPSATGGPPIVGVQLRDSHVPRGVVREKLDGALDGSATAGLIGLEGAEGAWIIPTGPADSETPGAASLHTVFGLTEEVPAGPFTVLVAATDAAGRIGEAATLPAIANDDATIPGTLVIGLAWSGRADLDIHVVDALGGEAWTGDPNTFIPPPPGTPTDPNDPPYKYGGILDHDGNGSCIPGVASEHVIWTEMPPPGDYIVRVDTRSLCGDAAAPWYVAAFRDVPVVGSGVLIDAARGLATPASVLEPHGRGAGELALRFTIP